MSGDTVTISKESHLIAIRYGKNVSRGIQEMEAVIQKQKSEIAQMGAWIEERV